MLPTRTEVSDLYTGMWPRFRAGLLDLVIVWVAFFASWIGITSVFPAVKLYIGSLYFYLPMLLSGWLYCALLECSPLQATLGKLAIRARVTDAGGLRISFARASARYFAKLVSAATLGIGFLISDVTARRQALHDLLSGTCVVQKQSLRTWREKGTPAPAAAPAPAWTRVQTVRASLGLGLSLLILAGLGYCMDRQFSASDQLRSFCVSIKPGTSREQLDAMIAAAGFKRVDQGRDGSAVLLRHPRSIYPNDCYIEMDDGKVKSAKFVPYD